jgi:hypothetical protein
MFQSLDKQPPLSLWERARVRAIAMKVFRVQGSGFRTLHFPLSTLHQFILYPSSLIFSIPSSFLVLKKFPPTKPLSPK